MIHEFGLNVYLIKASCIFDNLVIIAKFFITIIESKEILDTNACKKSIRNISDDYQ